MPAERGHRPCPKCVPAYDFTFPVPRRWRGPLEALTKPLDIPAVRGLLPRGGTILGSSRTNPFAVEDGVQKIRTNLQNLGVEALIAIGGEDTLGVAAKLYEIGVNVVGVPKTIDNDLSGTDYTFGFDTAVNIAMEAIDRLHSTAESHHRALIVEVMGRHAGWIALHAGMAGGANAILIPEVRFDIAQVCKWVEARFRLDYAPIHRGQRGGHAKEGGGCLGEKDASGTSGWRLRSDYCPRDRARTASRPAPPCSWTCSAAAPRPAGPRGHRSGCTRSTRWPSASGPETAWRQRYHLVRCGGDEGAQSSTPFYARPRCSRLTATASVSAVGGLLAACVVRGARGATPPTQTCPAGPVYTLVRAARPLVLRLLTGT